MNTERAIIAVMMTFKWGECLNPGVCCYGSGNMIKACDICGYEFEAMRRKTRYCKWCRENNSAAINRLLRREAREHRREWRRNEKT